MGQSRQLGTAILESIAAQPATPSPYKSTFPDPLHQKMATVKIRLKINLNNVNYSGLILADQSVSLY